MVVVVDMAMAMAGQKEEQEQEAILVITMQQQRRQKRLEVAHATKAVHVVGVLPSVAACLSRLCAPILAAARRLLS